MQAITVMLKELKTDRFEAFSMIDTLHSHRHTSWLRHPITHVDNHFMFTSDLPPPPTSTGQHPLLNPLPAPSNWTKTLSHAPKIIFKYCWIVESSLKRKSYQKNGRRTGRAWTGLETGTIYRDTLQSRISKYPTQPFRSMSNYIFVESQKKLFYDCIALYPT